MWDEEGEQTCVRFRIENFQKLVVDEGEEEQGTQVSGWVTGSAVSPH